MAYDRFIDFFTYILFHTANIDGSVAVEEKEMIIEISGTKKLGEIITFYNNHSDEEREIYFESMKEMWLTDDDRKALILNKVREVIGSDLVIEKDEKELYQNIKDFLYRW